MKIMLHSLSGYISKNVFIMWQVFTGRD